MEVTLNQDMSSTALIHPKKFIVYLLAVSSVMLFAGLSSAVIVSKMSGEWLQFDLPTAFVYSSLAVVISSLTLHMGYVSLKKGNLGKVRTYLIATIVLGIAFLIVQFASFSELLSQNVFFGGSSSNPAGSYIYILTTLHGLHLIIGLGFVAYVLVSLSKGKITVDRKTRYEGCQIFWHFLGGLWIYLYVFLIIYH